jgi:hypothetical protein
MILASVGGEVNGQNQEKRGESGELRAGTGALP